MAKMLYSVVAVAASIAAVDAATCTNDQVRYSYSLYQQVAALPGCAPFAVYSGTEIRINWKCNSNSCTPIIMELASKLPYCEHPTTGVKHREQLEDILYNQCQICTYDQQKQTQGLWQAAAKTSACSPYATSIGTQTSISWPCSATGCTAVLKDLATKVPDCYTGGVNEKTRILKPVSACTSVNPSPGTPSPNPGGGDTPSNPSTPSPNSGGSGTCTQADATLSKSLWEAAAATSACKPYATVLPTYVRISWPCTATSCTAVMKQLAKDLPDCIYEGETESEKDNLNNSFDTCSGGGGDDGDDDTTGGDATPSPSSTSAYASDTCSAAEVSETVDLYLEVAQSDACATYSAITTFSIVVKAPCTSPCVTQGFQKLATELDDCYYSYDYENKKEQVNKELDKCPSASGKRPDGAATSDTVTISYYSKDPVQAPVTSAPQMSAGPVVRSASAVVAVVALVVSQVVMILW